MIFNQPSDDIYHYFFSAVRIFSVVRMRAGITLNRKGTISLLN